MIEVESVYYDYNGHRALIDVSVSFKTGNIYVLMGENGAGKSTLLKHLNGILKPKSGRVLVDGVDTREATVAELCRKVGLVFQNPELQFFCETVFKEVAFGPENLGLDSATVKSRVENALRVVGLTGFEERVPWSLSGGEMRRLALASILSMEPKYLALDEPTVGQDRFSKENLKALIWRFKGMGKSVIIATHDIEWVYDLKPDEIILMSHGRIVAQGPPWEILNDNELLERCNLVKPILLTLCDSLKLPLKSSTPSVTELAQEIRKRIGEEFVLSRGF